MRHSGTFTIMLHAHLPYVRHPEHPEFLEEDWLFEAITETYVPLLLMMERLLNERVPFRLAMSITPPLAEMLADGLLKRRYVAHLEKLIELADAQAVARRNSAYAEAAAWQARRLHEVHDYYVSRRRGDLLGAFAAVEATGSLSILTCAATHGFLPLMATDEARWAQIAVGVNSHRRHFGRAPRGIWIPECAYAPGLEHVLNRAGLQYFFVESHGLTGARPAPPLGTARPIRTPSGVYAFGRDPSTSKQVWSSQEGYPGDSLYREFYRDLGYDLPYDEVRPYLHSDGVRRNVGLKFHRITGKVDLGSKQPYVPSWARKRAAEHAGHFLVERVREVRHLAQRTGVAPHITAPFDAELFGHWWYEGPEFIEYFLRKVAFDQTDIRMVTPEEHLAEHPNAHVAQPALSSWGDKGYFEVWLNGGNDWIYPHLHNAEERIVTFANRYPVPPDAVTARVLAQCARELLLAQSSDWAFIMTMDTSVPYAIRRTREHLHRFHELADSIDAGRIDAARLAELEWMDSLFPTIDYRHYHPSQVTHRGAGSAVLSA